jgi:hypothetical protein
MISTGKNGPLSFRRLTERDDLADITPLSFVAYYSHTPLSPTTLQHPLLSLSLSSRIRTIVKVWYQDGHCQEPIWKGASSLRGGASYQEG